GFPEEVNLTRFSLVFSPSRLHHSRRLSVADRDVVIAASSSFGLSIKGGACQGDSAADRPFPFPSLGMDQ
ncbi:hypothetical protein E2320_008363, partial [Naja naja]